MYTSILHISCSLRKDHEEDNMVPVEMYMSIGEDGTDYDLHCFLLGEQERLKSLGWSYEHGRLMKVMQVPENLIQSDNSEINEQKVFISTESGKLLLQLKGGLYSINMEDLFKNMYGCCDQAHATGTKSMSEAPRCNDFNGPLGNGQNDQEGLQELINFLGSDCERAMSVGLCWDEHTKKIGCYDNHGGVLCTDLL